MTPIAPMLPALVMASSIGATADDALDALNVVWDSPSADHHGSMPLGNGEISVNAWMDGEGDLHFYIGRIDSWSAGGHLLKVGKVRVSFTPALALDGAEFRQELNLRNGEIVFRIGGTSATTVRLWADANNPVVRVDTESQAPLAATAHIEMWRAAPYTPAPDSRVSDPYSPLTSEVMPDTLLPARDGRIGWYHHNDKSYGAVESMRYQGIDDYPGFVDPLINRTFGAIVTAKGALTPDDMTLTTEPARRQSLSVYCTAAHPSTPEEWLAGIEAAIASVEATDPGERYEKHCAWWGAFWDRSYIHITENGAGPRTRRAYPDNDLPVRIGFAQDGGSVFTGELGRVAIYDGAQGEETLKALAASPAGAPGPDGLAAIYSGFPSPSTELTDSAGWDAPAELTIEAWVRPGPAEMTGRIIDKITPGGSDGFLLDAYPAGQIRLIAAGSTIISTDALPAGEWAHLAAVLGAGGPALYINGAKAVGPERGGGSDAEAVSRGYALQRFINACAGRGRYPIKFNGSIFTVPCEGRAGDADYRAWGPGYWWQNTRLPYISMCASGDFDLMQPLFRMYVDEIFPLCEFRVRKYFGYDGAYLVECMHPWGAAFPDTYGHEAPWDQREDKLQSSGWHKWEWVAGPELVHMMLDYAEYTGDDGFLTGKTLRVAESVARFFANFYKTDDDGKLIMHPSQALETWWDVTGPMPEIAGLRAISERILALPGDLLTGEQRDFWRGFYASLPELPTREVEAGIALAAGWEFAQKSNVENPELYAVFPFRQVAVGKPNIEWGINALHERGDRGPFGWRQDDIFMAYLGLAEEAREYVVARARTHDAGSRFPAFWGPNYDWIPDQDHGGVLLRAVQSMLMQADGRAIHLLPAWPEGWNADFKLHAPYETTVEASVRGGKVVALDVTPKEREADVVIGGQ